MICVYGRVNSLLLKCITEKMVNMMIIYNIGGNGTVRIMKDVLNSWRSSRIIHGDQGREKKKNLSLSFH